MSRDKDLLKKRKERLLGELESIKGLLESEQPDNIPLLQDALIEDRADPDDYEISPSQALQAKLAKNRAPTIEDPFEQALKLLEEEQALGEEEEAGEIELNFEPELKSQTELDRLTTDPVVTPRKTNPTPNSVLPGQRSLFNDTSSDTTEKAPEPKPMGSHASLSQNPFLPPHVRQRFEKASQTSEPDESSTSANTLAQQAVVDASYTERLVDQLVAHHLPKIEAELREKLLEVVKRHNERLKK